MRRLKTTGLAVIVAVSAVAGLVACGWAMRAAAAPAAAAPDTGTARITDVFIRTSTRQWRANLDIEIKGAAAAGTVNLTARMLDETGKEEKTFTQPIRIEAKDSQVVTATLAWRDPRLWDIGLPNLYTLKLAAKGAGIDQEYTQEFGFREFWIDGRDFYLNGTKVRFRPKFLQGYEENAKGLDHLISLGFNLGQIWPSDNDLTALTEKTAQIADRKGFALTGVPPNYKSYSNLDDPPQRAAYVQKLDATIKKVRNHPSILMWSTAANVYLCGRDEDPRLVGRRDWIVDRQMAARFQNGLKGIAILKEYDPTRPSFAHSGAYVGDIYTTNCYLDFHPLQEREDWLSAWAETGTMPLYFVECGTPLFCSYLRGRTGFDQALETEPMATEWAAAYFGAEEYRKETPAYRAAIARQFNSGTSFKSWRHVEEFLQSPAVGDTQRLFITNTWRSWRTWGISGGMVPWEEACLHLDLVKPVNQPALAWIAGSAPQGFTAKDHSFAPGERLAKQIVLINDYRTEEPYTINWTADLAGKAVGKGANTGRLKPAEILFVPIEAPIPNAIAGDKADGTINLAATIGTQKMADELKFHILAPAPEGKATAHVFDPAGETAAMLKSLGVTMQMMAGSAASAPAAGSLVIVGRRALSQGHAIPLDIEAFLKGGGRMLVMAQDRLWMRQGLGLRTAEYFPRRVFRIDPSHPVVAGLDDFDLSDWAGSSHLMPETMQGYGPDVWQSPIYGWHWGNRGVVSSAAVEKPHRTSWRPILECEFDLAYSPLMEMDYGKGRLTFCTLDLEDHVATDAAARRLALNLVNYVATAPLTPKAEHVVYVGDATGAALLDLMGVEYEKAEKVDPASGGLVILGPGGAETGVKAFAEKGGKVVVLPRETPALDVAVAKQANFAGSTAAPAWPEAAGLSASDLRWKSSYEAWLVKGGPGVEVGADGLLGRMTVGAAGKQGSILFCQIDPTSLPADSKTYFRYTRWRQMRALAQVLANAGATFKQDLIEVRFFQRPDHENVPTRFYHDDFLDSQKDAVAAPQAIGNPDKKDFVTGDNPYRYYRW